MPSAPSHSASIFVWVLLFLPTASIALAAPPDRVLPALVSLTVEPTEVLLCATNRQQQLLVTGRTADGKLVDVTHLCEMSSSDLAVFSVSAATARGRHDGTAEVRVKLGSLTVQVPVRVRDSASYPPVHFGNDIVPLFSKLGCNNGGCHGKASGQNGFKLSVFGFDPQADHNALVKEGRGRRVLPAVPERSLLLMKPTGQVPHGGGRRVEAGSTDYELLREWIKQGMPFGRDDAPHVVGLRVSPSERVLGFDAEQQVLATAVFSDGSTRDVTAAASYTSNAAPIADADRAGRIRTGQAPGEAAITVHYMDQIAAVLVRVPRPGAPDPYPALPVNNKVDELVWAKLKVMGIVPSDLCDDATFLRRLHLDVLGTLPTPDQTRAFLADTDKATAARHR